MQFSSVPFLCFFLIGTLAAYFLAPKKAKNAVLLCGSLLFYFYGETRFCIVMVLSGLAGYLIGRLIDRTQRHALRLSLLVTGVLLTLAPLLVFKYADFFIANLNRLLHSDFALLGLAMPIGISFYTFQILSYIVDVYRRDVQVQKNPIHFLTYVTLFPQLIAGPIVRYQTVQEQLEKRRLSLSDFSGGITRFAVGLGKKVIIADSLAELISALAGAESLASYWMRAAAFTLQIYFDFSGYSDMAIGLGRMLGFRFCENFDHPFVSGSVTEFWRRWHISLGTWFRDYVYIPLGGNRCARPRWVFNVLVVWLLTGFWHGAAWNFIVWGLYFALLLLAEKLFLGPILEKIPRIFRVCWVMLLITLSFVIFNADSLSQAAVFLSGMFSFGALPLTDSVTNYYLSGSAVLLLAAAIGATPFPVNALRRVQANKIGGRVIAVLEPVFVAATLLVVLGYLVDGSFSPFLYFRF